MTEAREPEPRSGRGSRFWLDPSGALLRGSAAPHATFLGADDAVYAETALRRLCVGQRLPLIFDARPVSYVQRDARPRAIGVVPDCVSAVAVIVEPPISRVTSFVLAGSDDPGVPIRLFTSEQTARRWLEEDAPH